MPHLRRSRSVLAAPDEDDGRSTRPGTWKIRRSARRGQDAHGQEGEDHPPDQAAELLEGLDPAPPPSLVEAGADPRTSARPGTIRGTC